MNIAFSSFVIIILFLPGILFRIGYFYGDFSKKFVIRSIQDEIIFSIIPAFIFHFIWYLLTEFSSYKVNLEIIGFLISGNTDTFLLLNSLKNIEQFVFQIITYNVSINVIALFCGYYIRSKISQKGIDIAFSALSYNNRWHYIFKGSYLDALKYKTGQYGKLERINAIFGIKTERIPKLVRHIDFVIVNVLVLVDGKAIVYSGYAEDYILDKDGGVYSLTLKYPCRIELDKYNDKLETKNDDIVEINNDFLIIPNSQILNLSFSYFANEQTELNPQNLI